MAEQTQPDDPIRDGTPTPDPTMWKRKHTPEAAPPPDSDEGGGSGGWKFLFGAVISVGVSIFGFVATLDKGPTNDGTLPPVAHTPELDDALRRLSDRTRPPAAVLAEVETLVAGFEPRMAALEKAVNRVRSFPNSNERESTDAETLEMYANLRRIFADFQTRLGALDPTRLTPDQQEKRDRLVDRVENLRCTLVAISGRDE